MGRKRFESEFAPRAEDKLPAGSKPFEYRMLFDGGQSNDAFRMGMSFGQRSVKFFSPFYASDLVVASPLGLRMITGAKGDKLAQRDYDFLSSVEVLLVDQFDVCALMQNYAHLQAVMDVINLVPYDPRHTDFARMREWALSGQAKHVRQTVLTSAFPSRELSAFWAAYCRNADGALQLRASYRGVLSRVGPPVKQIFQRFHAESLQGLADARFDYFVTTVLPQLKSSCPEGHVLLFVPSYFDYVRVRNYAKAKHLTVALASEYTKNSELSRGRSAFFHGERKFLIMTERFHFFRRYQMRGVRHVVFYALPAYEQFYVDLLNWLPAGGGAAASSANADVSAGDKPGTCMALFSKFDGLELERIVGTQRAAKLLHAVNSTHMFC